MTDFKPWTWARAHPHGYECSTYGDRRFSAFVAQLSDGRTIEEHYQCDIKGFQPGGRNWRLGKGKPPLLPITPSQLWDGYMGLWMDWSNLPGNDALLRDLTLRTSEHRILTDKFASTPVNQAHALSVLLNLLNRPS